MNTRLLSGFALTLGLALSVEASADMYKCKDTDGKIAYQETPCQGKSEKINIQSENKSSDFWDAGKLAKIRAKMKVAEAENAKIEREKLHTVTAFCIAQGCDASTWRYNLLKLPEKSVSQALGTPREQLVGNSMVHYYDVKTPTGRAKLQLIIDGGMVNQVNVY